ncbi:NAD(P)H-dependent oxidoreductase [uncultured Castellaniella sp.]|uniref:NADPH-dependent FMN reductase n=1 Tax=uncultured Castellaniella sp. TaxID=647907 RepID=UPI00262E317A|nr:NAD(P)H-dependent oxidoreductase [uncultured Castellaniella sp.]
MSIRVLAIGGSLRQGSYNHLLLEQARRQAPQGMSIEIADLSDVPLYNGDVQAQGFPGSVQRLAEQAAQADAFLIATPEYNYSIPGVLKNAIDWVSRVPGAPFQGKPAAIASASMGGLGGSRAQYHLRQVLVYLDLHPLNKPELFISAAHEKFAADGELTDAVSRDGLDKLLAALAAHTRRLQALDTVAEAA